MKTWTTRSGYKIFRVLSGHSNVFLLSNGEKRILIDTSPGYRWKKLNKRLKVLQIDRLDYLILTHTHYDHAGNSLRMKNQYHAKVIVHKSEAAFLLSGKNSLFYGTNAYTYLLVKLLFRPFVNRVFYKPCPYDILVDSTYDMKTMGFNAYILHTPGHSEGSLSVIVDNEIAMVGDCMFGIFRRTVFPPFAIDPWQMVDSWGKLLDTGCILFLPSHGNENTREMVQQDFNRRNKHT
jgi:glyoxylase-like metal-dependent hydrolase (beta-lactamase superfamily II)